MLLNREPGFLTDEKEMDILKSIVGCPKPKIEVPKQ
jgi:hypothetical protein